MTNTPHYLVVADDGSQYGPITESEMRTWIEERRVQGHNQAWREGSPEWKPLNEHSQFRDMFKAMPTAKPPAPPRPAVDMPEAPTIAKSTIVCAYILAVLMPLFGFFAGIYLLAKKQVGHGVASMAISVVTFLVFMSMMAG